MLPWAWFTWHPRTFSPSRLLLSRADQSAARLYASVCDGVRRPGIHVQSRTRATRARWGAYLETTPCHWWSRLYRHKGVASMSLASRNKPLCPSCWALRPCPTRTSRVCARLSCQLFRLSAFWWTCDVRVDRLIWAALSAASETCCLHWCLLLTDSRILPTPPWR